MLFTNIQRYKKNVCLLDFNDKILFSDIIKKSEELKKKIKKRLLVFLICDNQLSIIFYYICLLKIKIPILLVDSKTDKKEIIKLIEQYKPYYIVSDKSFIKDLKDLTLNVIDIFKTSCLYKTNFKSNYKINPNLSLLLPTSGSVGSPKFVNLSYTNIDDNTKKIISYLKINFKDRAITNMPFAYSYMLSIINSHIDSGGSIFITKKSLFDIDFWKYFKKFKITSFNGVPFIYEMLEKIGFDRIFHSSLRYITQAGGHLNEKTKKQIIKMCNLKKKNFYVMYGQTEASPRISYLDAIKNRNKINSVGKPLKGTRIFLIDEKNKKIKKKNHVGKIIFCGKNVFLGYSKNFSDLKKTDRNKGKLVTGDLGYLDKDNYLYITGRFGRIAKIFGIRLQLDDIEKKMSSMGFEVVCLENKKNLIIFYENSYDEKIIKHNIVKITNINPLHVIPIRKKFPRNKNGKINLSIMKNLI